MPDAGEIAQWIDDLSASDDLTRGVSALKLYLAGGTLWLGVAGPWIADPEFRALQHPFSVDEAGLPSSEKTVYVVGIAVRPETFARIRAANGWPRLADVPPDQDALEFELHLAGIHYFDVLTTREPGGSGAIARYLEKFGEGIQQIEMLVTDVDRATEILRARFSLQPVYPTTRAGADGTRVNFFLVPAPDGKKVLIELVEAA